MGMSLKERMAALAQNGMTEDPKVAAAKAEVEQERLTAEAFRSSTFYYGTVGSTGPLKTFLDTLTAKQQAALDAKRQGEGKRSTPVYYWPGERARAYLADHDGRSAAGETAASPTMPATPAVEGVQGRGMAAQMMDMYYGGEEQELHELRNPQIGKYIHQKMGYVGDYDQHKSGRDAYMDTYSTGDQAGVEGWQWPKGADGRNNKSEALFKHPETQAALTGTMEISRYIRDGIFKYGGTLVFEGKFVYNEGNFVPGAYQGDTNKEAEALFPYWAAAPGKANVPFGKGTLVYHHGGAETAPTQWLLRQRWAFAAPSLPASHTGMIPPDSPFWKLPAGSGPEETTTKPEYDFKRLKNKVVNSNREKAAQAAKAAGTSTTK